MQQKIEETLNPFTPASVIRDLQRLGSKNGERVDSRANGALSRRPRFQHLF
jgi:hypothetical protein